jgi:hypothetical protein
LLGLSCAAPSSDRDVEAELAAAKRARDCAASKEKAAEPCAAEAACFAPYREQFPRGASLEQVGALSARLAQSCAAGNENQVFVSAKQCVARANACVVDTCYAEYLRRYADGAHAAEAQADILRAKQACRAPQPREAPLAVASPLADGEYSGDARAAPSCGIRRQYGLHLLACKGQITWIHEAPLAPDQPPVPMKWEGAIGADGALKASVRGTSNYSASARISETQREIEMSIPGCAAKIRLTVRQQLSPGCSGR